MPDVSNCESLKAAAWIDVVAAKLQIKSASDGTALLMLGASRPAIQANLTDISIVAVGNLMLHWSFLSLPLHCPPLSSSSTHCLLRLS